MNPNNPASFQSSAHQNVNSNGSNHSHLSAQFFIPNSQEEVDSDVLPDSDEEKDEELGNEKEADEESKGNERKILPSTIQSSFIAGTPHQSSSSYPQMDDEIEQYLNEHYPGSSHPSPYYLDEDEQIYQLFVQSVHDEQIAERIIGNSDDDEDDEYNPDQSDEGASDADEGEDGEDLADYGNGEGEEDEEGGERGGGAGGGGDVENDEPREEIEQTNKVQTREIRDLLNECWLEIAGSKPSVPLNYPLSQHSTFFNPNKVDQQLTIHSSSDNPSADTSSDPYLFSRFNAETAQVSQTAAKPSASLISSIVSQLITGQKPTETFIDGLPLTAIRKIVARQMSMALQLLIQIMLQAEDHSECFDKCYQQLLILSNLRNAAVKKAKLFQMNLELLKNLSNTDQQQRTKLLKDNEFQQILMEVAPHMNHLTNNSQPQQSQQHPLTASSVAPKGPSVDSTTNNYRKIMTRSSLKNQDETSSDRSSTIFDIPILSKIHEFMMKIDLKKRHIQQELLPFQSSSVLNNSHLHHHQHLHHHHQHHQLPHSLLLSAYPSFKPSHSILLEQNLKLYKFLLYEQSIKQLYQESSLKYWNCLIPKSNYPFLAYDRLLLSEGTSTTSLTPASTMLTRTFSSVNYSLLNPMTIEGRKFFTPAEDDLLLKGIMEFGDDRNDCWIKIHQKYLTFKKLELLQFHYHEKTLFSSNLQNNDFKRYQYYLERVKLALGNTGDGQNNHLGIKSMMNQKIAILSQQNNNQLHGMISPGALGGVGGGGGIGGNGGTQRKKDDKWVSIEDIYLLKAFQIFGEKYPLISLFHLPHRSSTEIRNRWTFLQNVWNRAFNLQKRKLLLRNPNMTIIYDSVPMMSNEVKAFLWDMNDCSDYQSLQELWFKGGWQMKQLNKMGITEAKPGMQDSLSVRKNGIEGLEFSDAQKIVTTSNPNRSISGNQIDWTSIMDGVSDFEQDTLTDSSDEDDADEQIQEKSAKLSKIKQPNPLPAPALNPNLPQFNVPMQVPQDCAFHPFNNPTTQNEAHNVSQSVQLQTVHPKKAKAAEKSKRKRKHESTASLNPDTYNKTDKKPKTVSTASTTDPMTFIDREQTSIVHNETTNDLINQILPTFLDNSMAGPPTSKSGSEFPTFNNATKNIEEQVPAGSKLLYDEFSLDFTKLFKEESNHSSFTNYHTVLPTEVSPNESLNAGLFASVMMNVTQK